MRRITLFFIASVALLWASSASAGTNTLVPTYFVNQDFSGLTSATPSSGSPANWTWNLTSTTINLYSANGGINYSTPSTQQMNVTGSGSGNRGLTVSFPTSGTEPSVYVNFDWLITSQVIGQKNAIGLFLHGSGATVADPQNILCLYNCGSGGYFYCWNLQKDSTTFITNASFNRASATSAALTSTRNAGCMTTMPLTTGVWFNIKAKLNFTTHVIDSLTITKKSDGTNVVLTALPFLSTTANDVAEFTATNTKSSNAGNGGSAGFNFSFDNFQTYKMVQAVTTNVTVNYLDPNGVAFKTANVVTNQAVGSTYTALASDKVTYNDGINYYVYDASSTLSDNVVVLADGTAQINLKFKKTPVTTGTYTWTGISSGNWNELDTNFSTNGVNSIGYQTGNAATFSGAGLITSVVVNNITNLGTGNLTVSSPGYSFSGTGTLNGSGSLNINLSGTDAVTLGLANNMTGATQIAGGTVNTSLVGTLGSSVVVNGPATINSNFAIPSTTFNASTTISSTAANTIADMAATAGTKVTVASTVVNSNAVYAFGFSPTGTFAGELELDGNSTDTRFGLKNVLSSYFATGRVTLKGTAFLFLDAAQTAATTISIGTLSGESGTKLGWGKIATLTNDINWSVGALNESSTYAGSLTNMGGYQGSGSFYAGNLTNFIKEGTGTLTMSGTANTHNGNFTVNGGTLKVTGAIGNATSVVTVAAAGILSGTGNVGGPTTINGTLQGSLIFGSSLVLAGTTNLNVNGFSASQFDSILVAGTVTNGGTLNITINATEPTTATSIRLLKAATYSGTFATVNIVPPATSPSSWSFDQTTGILTYNKTVTSVNSNLAGKISVYPTLTHGIINIAGGNVSSVEIANLAGQLVKQVSMLNGKTSISLSNLSTGAYFVKVISTDGSVNVQKVIYQN